MWNRFRNAFVRQTPISTCSLSLSLKRSTTSPNNNNVLLIRCLQSKWMYRKLCFRARHKIARSCIKSDKNVNRIKSKLVFFLVILREIVRNQVSHSRHALRRCGEFKFNRKIVRTLMNRWISRLILVSVFRRPILVVHLILRQTSILRKAIRFVCLFPFNSIRNWVRGHVKIVPSHRILLYDHWPHKARKIRSTHFYSSINHPASALSLVMFFFLFCFSLVLLLRRKWKKMK